MKVIFTEYTNDSGETIIDAMAGIMASCVISKECLEDDPHSKEEARRLLVIAIKRLILRTAENMEPIIEEDVE